MAYRRAPSISRPWEGFWGEMDGSLRPRAKHNLLARWGRSPSRWNQLDVTDYLFKIVIGGIIPGMDVFN